jgi:phospholipase A1/A2
LQVGHGQSWRIWRTCLLSPALCLLAAAGAPAFAETPPAELRAPPALAQPAGAGAPEVSVIDARLRSERIAESSNFVILPHRPNYVLPFTYNASLNRTPYGAQGSQLSPVEIKFQISFKLPVAERLFGNNGDLYLAYTQVSFWQAYNHDISAPFRETNYEPEAFLAFGTNTNILGLRNRIVLLGLVHQSNGREEPLSRSWNRAYAQFLLDRGNFALSLKPWYRFNESAATDDNPDINRYLGPGEVRMLYEWKRYVASVMFRCNFRPDNLYGAVQLEGSFPLTGKLKGYAQYFYGYGEDLIDYNARSNRIGIGILLTDWL